MATVAMSPPSETDIKMEAKPALTPPASEDTNKHDDSGSELSDLEFDGEFSEDIQPDHYYEGGKIPVFKPTMDQFRSFKKFIQKINKYGMRSGIVKVIPPKDWRDALPALDEQVKTIKVKNPITQEFHGTHGTYTQANIEKQRSYNLPQWKSLSEESNHQPPARRGERRRNQEKVTRSGSSRVARGSPVVLPNGKKRGPGRPRVRPLPTTMHKNEETEGEDGEDAKFNVQVPPTPTSPATKPAKVKNEVLSDDDEISPCKPKGRQAKSVSSRRKHNRRDQADIVDEEAFKDFDYRVYNQDEWTTERCQELETSYWKGLTFNNPMYGADMPGSLFDDSTTDWNVAKLENLLDVLGQKVPGVNTAYLYLGMWKATFAWHLEDVDLYSINYIHFGAPKQWYSISQEDARRFEAAMRSVWPNDAKNCDQFLRHKTYLISPQLLQSQYNIKVNRLVHHEGEFVITFPYGYHSGYNLGYNCAESVNFATEAWLDYGKVAKKCNCEADSVWVDVFDIERKLRGEQTPEYYEETEDDGEDQDDEEDGPTDLPTPPGSDKGKPKVRSHKRKRDGNDKDVKPKVKRLRIKIKAPAKEPCILCPNDNAYEVLLPTDNGHRAHRRCALYTPETYIAEENGKELVCDVDQIDKARLDLKCNYCRSKTGAVFQCSSKKCIRAYHATCAASAGVQVDIGMIPVFDEDGTEYTDTGIDYRCRFHRIKRDKNLTGNALEENASIRKQALKIATGELIQAQYFQSDIFAGVVLENRRNEQTLLLEVLPKGDKIEVEYKWLLIFDRENSQLPRPSENAKPLPAHLARKSRTSKEDPSNECPKPDEPFCDPKFQQVWSEFHTAKIPRNPVQVKIDINKSKTLWFYLGKTSTEAKAQYTGNISIQINDPTANFLESVKPLITTVQSIPRRSYPASYPTGINVHALNLGQTKAQIQYHRPQITRPPPKSLERPYNGKYKVDDPIPYEYKPKSGYQVDPQALRNQRTFLQTSSMPPSSQYATVQPHRAPRPQMSPVAPMAPMMSNMQRRTSSSGNQGSDDYKRWAQPTYQSSQQHSHYHHQPQAPVANMMASSSNSSLGRNPFSPSVSSFGQQQLLVPHNPPPETRKRSDSVEALAKYPYLHAAALKRPPVYQSPYPAEGGFAPEYLPHPTSIEKDRLRHSSLSEEFLMHRTPSQQEQVKAHVRKISEDKALRQRQAQLEQQRRQAMPPPQLHQPQKTYPYMPPHNFQSQQYHNHQNLSLSQVLSPEPSFQSSYSTNTYSNHPYSQDVHPPSHFHSSYSQPQHHSPTGLQFQSPQDFQMQMLREAEHHEQHDWPKGNGSYESFLRNLQHAGGEHTCSDSGGAKEAGSPLRRGMRDGGGEMLPMMDERF